MFKKTCEILNQYVDDYAFVDTKTYQKERSKIIRNDAFSDYAFLDGYQTIITMVLSYPSQPVKWQGKGYGVLSRYSYGTDYHIVFRDKISKIEQALNNIGIKAKGYVDISPVDERFAAKLSTIGFIGKNQFLIHPVYGSYIYLASILVDVKLNPDIKPVDDCGECRICIEACPSGALNDGYDRNLCISEVSQAKKVFDEKEILYFKSMIYGCDICQKVCPKNKGIDFHIHSAFEPEGIENINVLEIIKMSNKLYKNIYGNNASSWKGAGIIKRNALALMYNHKSPKLDEAVRLLEQKYSKVPWFDGTIKQIKKLRKERE